MRVDIDLFDGVDMGDLEIDTRVVPIPLVGDCIEFEHPDEEDRYVVKQRVWMVGADFATIDRVVLRVVSASGK